jgi:hypothetical protein
MPKKLTESEYDLRLSSIGKVVRIGHYVNGSTKILHRCLIHNEVLQGTPSDLLNGHGLYCCWNGGLNKQAKLNYDKKLKETGNLERVEEYKTSRLPIKHRCLTHNLEFFMPPRRALMGRKPPCCVGNGRKSLYSMLMSPGEYASYSKSYVYIYQLKNYPNYHKIGISYNIKTRSDDPEYGELVCCWENSRINTFLIEQASLSDNLLNRICPEELIKRSWPGKTEVVNNKESLVVDVVQYYVDQLEYLGKFEFILNYLNPSEEEKSICLNFNKPRDR